MSFMLFDGAVVTVYPSLPNNASTFQSQLSTHQLD